VADIIINTGKTLSIFTSPGQDKLFPTVSSQSVFTFGDFRIDRGNIFDNLELSSSTISFSNFSTLENFSSSTINEAAFTTKENELNPDVKNPNSYSYFGSFYTKVSRGINSLIESFPYAILVNTSGLSDTIFGYSIDSFAKNSTFNVPISAITNQGNIIYASGITDINTATLFKNFNVFSIQFSGTANTQNYDILNYSYTTGTTGYMQFTIDSLLTGVTASTSTQALYIRPTPHNYSQYQRTISNLEYQLAFDGTFKVPDNDNDSVFVYETFTWPRLVDGFNIDTYGTDFDSYKDSILRAATRIDEVKTSWMIRTMIPEQFIELDTDTQIYQKLISVYGEEFDTIKAYIDNLAFMHTVNYDRLESVPDKFMYKLSKLLAFDFHDSFSNADIFEYLLTEDEDGKTLQDYNLELWRKMLKNIVWLYKNKGTRDALMFIFKLIGAPESLISLNEFSYKINKINYFGKTAEQENEDSLTNQNKIADDGYINYNSSSFLFQEGGSGRGNGQDYINQWSPEFSLEKYVDNIKIKTGDTEIGTRDIVNSKELQAALDPAKAIESDVFDWYKLGNSTWGWNTTGLTTSPFSTTYFSGITALNEWAPEPSSILNVIPTNISAMTISQWLDYVYASNISPTNRKTTNAYSYNMSEYISLKKIYMTYMLWTETDQNSNKLTFAKLENLLELLERNFFKYLTDFIPSTSSIETTGTVYRNTVFERQKFVYPAGINTGSEFQSKLPDELIPITEGYSITSQVANIIEPALDGYSITNQIANIIKPENDAFSILANVKPPVSLTNFSFTMVGNFYPETEQDFTTSKSYSTNTINYTSGNTIVQFYGN